MFKKLLFSVVLIIFISLNVQSQCGYGGDAKQSGTTQSICYNMENSATNVALVNFTNVALSQHVRVNVIQGLTYTFTTSATDYGYIKRLSLYNATGAFIVQGNASANNTGVTLNWTATYTGQLRIQFNNNADCNSSTANTVTITATYTGGSNTADSQTAEGTNSWIGHVYDFSNATVAVPPSDANAFANYLGSFTQANTITGTTIAFSQSYGNSDNCFAFTAGGTAQTVRTDTFAVRYRMTSTLVGCYMVTISGDDGVRLYVDGVKVFDAWTQQSSTTYQNVLINLTGNSKLVFDYYEKNGSNVSDFSMSPVDSTINTIVTTGPITRCSGTNTVLDGSNIAYVGSSTNPSIKYQWQSSNDNSNFTDISGATAEDYTVPSSSPTANTTLYYRRVISGTNASTCSYPSSSISITTATAAVGGTVTGGTTICSGSTSGLLTLGGYTGNIIRWESSSNSFATITVINNTTSTYTSGPLTVNTQFRAVVQSGGSTCNTVNSNVTTVAINATSVAGTASANQSICSGSQPANITLTGNTGNIQWQVSTNNSTFSNIGGNSNTLTSAQMGALTATRYYRAVVTSGVCPSATSTTVVVTVNSAAPGTPGAISGTTPQCPGLTGQVYSIAAVTNATSYVWTVPAGWSITAGQGTTSVTVTTGNSSQSGNISVAAVNGCGTSTNQSYFFVNVSNPAPASAPVASAATSAQCEAVVANWSTVTNATGYYLDIATDNAFTNFVSGYNNFNIGYSTSNVFVGGLPGGTLYYRVRAYNSCGVTGNSNTITFSTTGPVGGTVASAQTICSGTQPANLTLSGNTGVIIRWEKSSDAAFTSPVTINNTTSTLTGATIGNLTTSTYFRAVVQIQSGSFCTAFSSAVLITVGDSGGTVASSQTICSGTQPATLTLSGYNGTILRWESANNAAFSSPTTIANTTATLTGAAIGNLTTTTYYRAVVQTPSCGNANSVPAIITVTPTVGTPTAITVASGTQPTCQLTNGTTTTSYATTATNSTSFTWSLSNTSAGTINASTGVMTWANGFSGTVNIQVVANGCNGPSSQVVRTVTITPAVGTPSAITIAAGSEPSCQLTNGTTTTTYATTASNSTSFTWSLSNASAGTINATTGVMTWANGFSGTVNIQVLANGCNGASAQTIRTVTINALPVITGQPQASAVCEGGTATFTVTSSTANVSYQWQYYNGTAWVNTNGTQYVTGHTSNTLTITPAPLAYSGYSVRCIVSLPSGCATTSGTALFTVSPTTVGGSVRIQGTAATTTTVCSGQTPTQSFELTGYTGTIIKWQKATDVAFTSPIDITETTAILLGSKMGAITAATYFRAVVQSGSCSVAFSNAGSITVQPNVSVGAASSTPNVCTGSAMTTITHTTTGATGIGTASGLPAGVTASWASNTITISGTPTVGGTYNYSIQVVGSCGPTVNATGTINVSGATPTATAATSPNCNGFTANWSSVVNATSYVLTIAEDNAFTIPVSGYTNLNVGNVTTYAATGLTALKTYYYRVVAVSSCGNSSVSNVISIEVKALLSTTWDGTSWDNSAPKNPNVNIIFNGNYNSSGDLSGCSCQVNVGTVNILGPNVLTLVNALKVSAGTLTFKDQSSLVQTTDVQNTGNIVYERNTMINRFDYTYYSSPVTGQTMIGLSPATLSDKFLTFDGANSKWIYENSAGLMVPAKGYVIRGPQSYHDTNRSLFVAKFTGVPNNGPVKGESVIAAKSYIVGNPYPSAIKLSDFLAANPFLEGTVRFWTHNTNISPSGSLYVYSSTDYASCNATGGTVAQSGGVAPNGYIGAGQSILVKVRAGESPSQIVFNNGMRKDNPGNNAQFFKTTKSSTDAKVWLNFSNPDGVFKQALIGYVDGATNSYEDRYDGTTSNANTVADFYSVNDTKSLAIQGRAYPLDAADVVPLGYKSTIDGSFTITIDHTQGDLDNQNVYLEDKVLNVVHDLKESPYTFTTVKGTFKERFTLKYTNKTLGTGDFETDQTGVVVSVKDQVIKVSSASENIKTVTIFDITGKLLFEKTKVNDLSLAIERLQSSNQVLLVKVVLDNDFETTKKIIF